MNRKRLAQRNEVFSLEVLKNILIWFKLTSNNKPLVELIGSIPAFLYFMVLFAYVLSLMRFSHVFFFVCCVLTLFRVLIMLVNIILLIKVVCAKAFILYVSCSRKKIQYIIIHVMKYLKPMLYNISLT